MGNMVIFFGAVHALEKYAAVCARVSLQPYSPYYILLDFLDYKN
jgi:hypothetical protein